MKLFTQPELVASSAASLLIAAHSHANMAFANRASKRTTWYPAFAEMATWSPIG